MALAQFAARYAKIVELSLDGQPLRLRSGQAKGGCLHKIEGEIIMPPTGVLETSKTTNPLLGLLSYGQSMWLDYIRRDLITSGALKAMIA
ncbi:MAG: hypothetical protein WAN17_18030, partial [Candidatus Sulfotelmatobacter sp.]